MSMEKKWGVGTLIVAGIIWGLVGFGYFINTNLNIINLILGGVPVIENIVYLVVGVCAIWVVWIQMQKK